jgi:prolyl-tRNA editing enzyme YbaK/EbsC (Cys-tRNA(Pro) deacylase)
VTTVEHVNVARVRAFAAERGVQIEIRRFPASTRTANDAAREIGVEVGRIIKSLVFLVKGRPVVTLCTGDERVSEVRLREIFKTDAVRRATADEAKRFTGYAIGGVPPFAHATHCEVLIDEVIHEDREYWAAAGLPDAVFAITGKNLSRLSNAATDAITTAPGTKWDH